LRAAFPNVEAGIVQHDMAYPAMLTYLPAGLLGIVVASLIAAFMSTLSTHLNWGASYIVNDFYKRFIKTNPKEKELVLVGRISIVVLMIITALVALLLSNALQAFQILLQIGAGTGLLFLLRWFWWRINAASEISAMIISFLVAVYFEFMHVGVFGFPDWEDWLKLVVGVLITTLGWVVVTLLTPATRQDTLMKFYRKVYPGGPGWRHILNIAAGEGEDVADLQGIPWDFPANMIKVLLGLFLVYSTLFATGFWLYNNVFAGVVSTIVALVSGGLLIKTVKSNPRKVN